MSAPEATVPPTGSGPKPWANRLQWLGRSGVVVVLLGIGVLWLHEFTVGLNERPAWKLKVMFVLIPLGVASALAQVVAWVVLRLSRRQKN
jgi:hypothetical protein